MERKAGGGPRCYDTGASVRFKRTGGRLEFSVHSARTGSVPALCADSRNKKLSKLQESWLLSL